MDTNATVEDNFTVTLTDDQVEDTDGNGFPDDAEITYGSNRFDHFSTPIITFGISLNQTNTNWTSSGILLNPPSGWTGNPQYYEFSMETYSTSGKFTLETENSGGEGDRFILLQGTEVIFDTAGGPLSIDSGGATSMQWHTTGSADSYDYDRFEINYAPVKPTIFKFIPLSPGDSTDIRGADGVWFTNDDLSPFDNGLFDNKNNYIQQLGLGISDGDKSRPWNPGADYSNNWFSGGVGEVATYPSSGSPACSHFGWRLDRFSSSMPITNLCRTVLTVLNTTLPLTFAENQPVGAIVGEFNATDPDAGTTLTYSLVSGAGDADNSLFTLETIRHTPHRHHF